MSSRNEARELAFYVARTGSIAKKPEPTAVAILRSAFGDEGSHPCSE